METAMKEFTITQNDAGQRLDRVDYAAEYLQRFGFPAQNIVHTESL